MDEYHSHQAALRKSDTCTKNIGYDYIHTKMKNWQNLSLVLEVRMSYFWRGRTGRGVIEGDMQRPLGCRSVLILTGWWPQGMFTRGDSLSLAHTLCELFWMHVTLEQKNKTKTKTTLYLLTCLLHEATCRLSSIFPYFF